MADPKNAGQFGNRKDTVEQARRGGKASGGSATTSVAGKMSRSEAGKLGAAAQPKSAKAKGGKQGR